MSKFWYNDAGIITDATGVVLCDDCPCALPQPLFCCDGKVWPATLNMSIRGRTLTCFDLDVVLSRVGPSSLCSYQWTGGALWDSACCDPGQFQFQPTISMVCDENNPATNRQQFHMFFESGIYCGTASDFWIDALSCNPFHAIFETSITHFTSPSCCPEDIYDIEVTE